MKSFNKKFKKLFISILIIAIYFFPINIFAKELQSIEYGKYTDAKEIVKEIMISYYNRGSNLQYNFSKTFYPIGAPEEATSQDNNYSVCAAFTYSVYTEGFGMNATDENDSIKFPRYNYDISDTANAYYTEGKNLNGNFLVYYENTKQNKRYIYGDKNKSTKTNDLETLINYVQPGDLFVYSGHALIAYDVLTNPKTNKKDVLIINSTPTGQIYSRIAGTSRLYYNDSPTSYNVNGIFKKINEGTIKVLWLSEMKQFVKNGVLDCSKDECAVVRIFYNKNGTAVFNFNINKTKYNKAKLRTEYRGLHIEKTVSTGDRDSVYLGNELTYTIKITNKSNTVIGKEKKYASFKISETVDSSVKYISSNNSGTYKNGKVEWTISELDVGKSVTLTYKVSVKNDLNNIYKTISSIGKFYSSSNSAVYINTGNVENKIIPKVNDKTNDYKTCYKTHSGKYGRNLINDIYKCVWGTDYKFNQLDLANMFNKSGDTRNNVKVTLNTNASSESKLFQQMILNSYYGGTVIGSENTYLLPRFSDKRARTINSSHFKDGDLLIYSISNSKYTSEKGIYSYIYIDGKFVGTKTSYQRPSFTYDYYNSSNCNSCTYKDNLYASYGTITKDVNDMKFINYQTLYDKDYYVILRPELVIQQEEKISIDTKPTKQNYILKKEKLDLAGGIIKIAYNNGNTKKINLNDSLVKVTGFDNTKVGINKLNVEYKGLKTTLDVNIIPVNVKEIEINKLPKKTAYVATKEKLDLSGGSIKVIFNDGTSEIINMTDKVISSSGFDNSKVGKNTITVKYGNYSKSFEININECNINSIKINKKPSLTTYFQNTSEIELSGGSISVIYSDTYNEVIEMTNENIKVVEFDTSNSGIKKVTLSYQGKTTSYDILVIEKNIDKIEVVTIPDSITNNKTGTEMDLSDGEIEIHYTDGTKELVEMNNTHFDIVETVETEDTKKLTMNYFGNDIVFDIEKDAQLMFKIETIVSIIVLIIIIIILYIKNNKKEQPKYNY